MKNLSVKIENYHYFLLDAGFCLGPDVEKQPQVIVVIFDPAFPGIRPVCMVLTGSKPVWAS